jgi:hypothetical protein
MRMRTSVRALALAAAVALVGCGGGSEGGESPTAAAETRPASTATLRIVSPQPNQVIEGSDVTVEVELDGGELVEEVSKDIQPDEGHLHLRLDGETITLLGGLTETIPDVAPGRHALEVEFVAADHGFFDPRVIQLVTFETTE